MNKNFECTKCKTPLAGHEQYQSGPFQPGYCVKCWGEVMGKEIPCPNCYGGHFRPCQWCGDSGRVTNVPHPYNAEVSERRAAGSTTETGEAPGASLH